MVSRDEESESVMNEWVKTEDMGKEKVTEKFLPKFKKKYWPFIAEFIQEFAVKFVVTGSIEIAKSLF